MNRPKDRVINKVNDLFEAAHQLVVTIEKNHQHLDSDDLEKIKAALNNKIKDVIDQIDNPPSIFKL